MTGQLGKRYVCATCGTEILCTRTGTGEIVCDGAPMTVMAPKLIPQTD